MRRMEMMTAGGVTLAGLGALVGLAIGSGDGGQKLPVPRAQPVEVRTEIIRRTVNVYRREHPHHVGRQRAGRQAAPASTSGAGELSGGRRLGQHAHVRAGHAAPSRRRLLAPAVATRSSGSRRTSGSSPAGSSGPSPVKTRSSGRAHGSSRGGSGSSQPVSTRSSGGGETTAVGTMTDAAHRVVTRSSGGHGERRATGGGTPTARAPTRC